MKDNSAHFFEGTEKLLEVWFSQQDEKKGTGDLRTIPRFVPFCACVWENCRSAGHMRGLPCWLTKAVGLS